MTDLEGLKALERISNHIEVSFDYSSDEENEEKLLNN